MVVRHLVFHISDGHLPASRPSGLVIRPLDPGADAESVTQVVEAAHDGVFPPMRGSGLLAELLGRPGRTVESWLAMLDDKPAGLVALAAAGEGGQVRHSLPWLLVSRQARRRGIATALVVKALESARDRGATELWVETRSDWPAATALWAALGFHPA